MQRRSCDSRGARQFLSWLGLLTALRENSRSTAKRRAADMHATAMKLPKRVVCKAVELSRSTYAPTPIAQTPAANPDAGLRATLRGQRQSRAHANRDAPARR